MNPENIQTQLRLIAFKAEYVEFKTIRKPTKLKSKFELNLGDLLIEENSNAFVKVFNVDLIAELEVEVIQIKVEFHTIFQSSTVINKEFLNDNFAKISAPAIGFPFVRSFISTITLQAGLPPIILPSINFIQFLKDKEQVSTATKRNQKK